MSKVTIEEAKSFLKFEDMPPEIENDVRIMLSSAYGFLKNGGVDYELINASSDQETIDQVKLAVQMLVTHWFDNRSAVAIGTITKEMEFSLDSIIGQLKWWAPSVKNA